MEEVIYLKKILLITFIIFLLSGCMFSIKKYISKNIELDLKKCNIVQEKDTHGGFLGDGDLFVKLDCSNLNNFNLSSNWKKLPVSSEINEIMNMKQCSIDDCLNVYEKYDIPNNINGYYYFLDRHSSSLNEFDDSDLNNRGSYNFTIALFDIDNKILYYYELDT